MNFLKKFGKSAGKAGEFVGLTAAAGALIAVSGVAGQEGALAVLLISSGVPPMYAGVAAQYLAVPIAGGLARGVQQIIKHRDKIFAPKPSE